MARILVNRIEDLCNFFHKSWLSRIQRMFVDTHHSRLHTLKYSHDVVQLSESPLGIDPVYIQVFKRYNIIPDFPPKFLSWSG